jgi:hypothetical protein
LSVRIEQPDSGVNPVMDAKPPDPILTVVETTALITLLDKMLGDMEKRLNKRLEDNSLGATDRWRLHEEAESREHKSLLDMILVVQRDFDAHLIVADAHFEREQQSDIAMDARVKPLRWVLLNRRDILIFLFGLLGAMAVLADIFSRYLGGPT